MEATQLVIIGSGPAGYTAGIYAARARLEPTLFAGIKSGGQLMYTSDVENYPGFAEGINGPQMMMTFRQQAERFGTNVQDSYVVAADLSQRPFKLWTQLPAGTNPEVFEVGSDEDILAVVNQAKQQPPDVEAQAVIISTGAVSILLGVPGERQLIGKGVSTCAVCDAAFFRDKVTYVIGGGDSAMEDTLALTKFAKKVTVIHRRDQFRASKIMQERVLNNDKVKVMWNSSLKEVIGADHVEKIKVEQDGQLQELPADGVFIAIGHKPVTQLLRDQLQLDDHGYVITRDSFSQLGLELARQHLDDHGLVKFPSMTSVPGVFAAGDVVDVRYKQAVTAAGQGCMAAIDAERWLELQ
ncbi:MAG: thioredoxin-disulfide reductase [Candidatus Pacebacteria bacterium CG10_big_fil_rev_8_21_14_0_10_56_10]|nr:MAG: thioredoxin-disulfide reductase [Candidatus Pacebacteria bacterium CG10_big_fil_rev_8_21_14_0_10_56_10]